MGNWSIEKEVINWISDNLENDKVILEFGSGNMTSKLCNKWNVFSVEENKIWVNKFHKQYIYAPIVDGWYDLSILKKELPKKVDLILVDGPAHGIRTGFNENFNALGILDLKSDAYVFDDVDRPIDLKCYQEVIKILKNNDYVIETEIKKCSKKKFSFIKIIK